MTSEQLQQHLFSPQQRNQQAHDQNTQEQLIKMPRAQKYTKLISSEQEPSAK